MSEEHYYNNAQELVIEFAKWSAETLREAIKRWGCASLIVPGGSTPVPYFQTLSQQKLEWNKVWISLTDERWLPAENPDSNENLLRKHLLINEAKAAHFLSLYNGHSTPEAGLVDCRRQMSELSRPFDLVVLGMGEDGHIASLFPHSAELEAGLTSHELCIATHPKDAAHARMSLTVSALTDSRAIALLINGQSKRIVYQHAAINNDANQLPVAAILNQDKVPVRIYWAP